MVVFLGMGKDGGWWFWGRLGWWRAWFSDGIGVRGRWCIENRHGIDQVFFHGRDSG